MPSSSNDLVGAVLQQLLALLVVLWSLKLDRSTFGNTAQSRWTPSLLTIYVSLVCLTFPATSLDMPPLWSALFSLALGLGYCVASVRDARDRWGFWSVHRNRIAGYAFTTGMTSTLWLFSDRLSITATMFVILAFHSRFSIYRSKVRELEKDFMALKERRLKDEALQHNLSLGYKGGSSDQEAS